MTRRDVDVANHWNRRCVTGMSPNDGFMMKGMHGGHDGNSMQGAPKRKFNSKEEEMADLRVRLEELQMQYDRLAKEIQADSASHHNSDHYRQAHSN